jgi:hypothetical protein
VLYVCVVLFGGRYVPALATQWVDHGEGGTAGAAGAGGAGGGGGALRLVAADVEMATLSPGREGGGAGGGAGTDVGVGVGVGEGGTPTEADAQRIDTRRGRTAEQRVALSTSVKRAPRGGAGAGGGLRGDGDGHDSGDEAPDRALPVSRAAAAWAAAESAAGGGGGGGGAGASSGNGHAAAAVTPPAGDAGGGSDDASDAPQTYPQQLRTWAITYSGIRDPHVMRWALPFTAPVRLALSLTMARSPCHPCASCIHAAMPVCPHV